MSDIKKFYLVSEHDYNLLLKAKGQQNLALPSNRDIDVKNNIELNKRLTEAVRDASNDDKGKISATGKMDEDEGMDQSVNDPSSLPDGSYEETEAKLEDRDLFLEALKTHLPAKLYEKAEILAKRILAIEETILSWETKTVKFGKLELNILEFIDYLYLCMTRRKPPEGDDRLTEFAAYLAKHGVNASLMTNPFVKTRMLLANPKALASSDGSPKNLFRNSPVKWFATKEEVLDASFS